MTAIGIDLGTTNSVVAFYDVSRRLTRVLANSEGDNLTPSVVSLRRRDDGREQLLVGKNALNWAQKAPEETIISIKRLMGRDLADAQVQRARERFAYRISSGPGEDPRAHVVLGGQIKSPAQVSSSILAKLKEDAQRSLGVAATHAVITVPAYFEGAQRAATREAGQLAGFTVKKIIDEPTAAAVAYGLESRPGERHRILVYDLGGGTFDISILQMVKDHEGHDRFQVMEIGGDRWLGGDDFDFRIVDRIIESVVAKGGDVSGDRRFLFLAKSNAEAAKKLLSQADEADIVIPAAFRLGDGPHVDVEITIARQEFEAMVEPFVTRSIALVQEALARQHLKADDITDVLLVGGATFTPLVYKAVENFFGVGKVRRTINPMECVALGASVLAATLQGVECPSCAELNDEADTACVKCGGSLAAAQSRGEMDIVEVTAMSLGIAAVRGSQGDVFAPIIPKGTPYPLREPIHRQFQAINQRLIRMPVYEGDEPVASKNDEQGVVVFELPEEIDVNTKVDVSFNYDRDRAITVTINIPGTRLVHTETLRHDRPRTAAVPRPDEEEDMEFAWREELDNVIDFANSFVERFGPYIEANQTRKIEREIELARQAAIYADEVAGRRQIDVLRRDLFNSGLATQLYLAERAAEGIPPDDSRRLHEAIRWVREAYDRGDREQAAEGASALRVLSAKALQERTGVEHVPDQEDYEGLLRLLDQ